MGDSNSLWFGGTADDERSIARDGASTSVVRARSKNELFLEVASHVLHEDTDSRALGAWIRYFVHIWGMN